MDVFESFFGTVNPFHIALDSRGQQVPMIQKIESDLHKDYVTDDSVKEADLILNVQCSLKEFFYGATKRVKFTKSITNGGTRAPTPNETVMSDGKMCRVTKDIIIQPGMRDGMTMRFENEGNTTDLKRVGDLVVKLHSAEGENMTRSGDDLIYHHRVTLRQALLSEPIQF